MNHWEKRKLKEKLRGESEEKYKQSSKKRLMKNIASKFQTTMIGALDQFEKAFGHLWGHNKTQLTPEEQECRRKWETVRTAILDNGNNQLRAATNEITQYTMTWDRYKTEFIIRKDYGNE